MTLQYDYCGLMNLIKKVCLYLMFLSIDAISVKITLINEICHILPNGRVLWHQKTESVSQQSNKTHRYNFGIYTNVILPKGLPLKIEQISPCLSNVFHILCVQLIINRTYTCIKKAPCLQIKYANVPL